MSFTFELVNKPNFFEKEVYFINSGYEDFSLLKSNKENKNIWKNLTKKKNKRK